MFEIEILKRVLDDYGHFLTTVTLPFLKQIQRNSGKKARLPKQVYKTANVLFSFINLVLRIHPKISLIIGPSSRYIKKLTYKCLSQLIRKNEPSLTWKHSTLIFTKYMYLTGYLNRNCHLLSKGCVCENVSRTFNSYIINVTLNWYTSADYLPLPPFNISSTKCNYCYMIRVWVGEFVKFYKHLHVAIKCFFPFNL